MNGGPEGVEVDRVEAFGVVAMVDDVDTMERADNGAVLAGMGDNASSVGASEMGGDMRTNIVLLWWGY